MTRLLFKNMKLNLCKYFNRKMMTGDEAEGMPGAEALDQEMKLLPTIGFKIIRPSSWDQCPGRAF